jgi:hypothetical protein
VTLTVYDLSGRLVETLVDQVQGPGFKSIVWRPEGLGSGVYFCRIAAGDFNGVRKVMLVR